MASIYVPVKSLSISLLAKMLASVFPDKLIQEAEYTVIINGLVRRVEKCNNE